LLTVGMSPLQVEDIRRTRLVPPNVKITAPAAGVVIARNATTGQQIKGGTELFRIADLRKVWIHADVLGVEANAVRPGLEAGVVVPGRQKSIRARVTDVLPQFDPSSQSLRIRLEADNAGYVLRPDMFVDVELRLPAAPAITVPREAVVQTGLETLVFRERGAGRFEPRRVRIGWRSGDRIEIATGLAPGDRVAVSGTFLLDSERRLRLNAAAARGAQ
jgi:membrane fusion protein, copper/silver efflux system